jgi:predicted metalloprotease with PDZ domain
MTLAGPTRAARAAALALAALLHLSLLFTFKVQETPPEKPPTRVALLSGDIELQPKEEDNLNPNSLHLNCPETYEGIGIKRRWGGMVTEVAKGWPADRAGIKVGDVIEPWFFDAVDGFMSFEVHRAGRVIKMRLKTERICFRDGPF